MSNHCILVVPCYNEANRLDVNAYRRFLSKARDISLVFVNDGSRDSTLSVLARVCEGFESIATILDLKINGGKGEAVRQGMLHAIQSGCAESVGFWDADLATPLDAVPQLLQVLENRPDIQMVFGSRIKLLGRQIERSPVRHYLGRTFATAVSVFMRLPVYDTQCGAKLFRITPELQQVLFDRFLSRWIFDVEIIARFMALHRGEPGIVAHTVYEFPLNTWKDVAGSKLRPWDFVVAATELWAICWRYIWRNRPMLNHPIEHSSKREAPLH